MVMLQNKPNFHSVWMKWIQKGHTGGRNGQLILIGPKEHVQTQPPPMTMTHATREELRVRF